MGKLFYGSDKDIKKAARKADLQANKHGACYTPARKKDCKKNAITGIWTCMAAAHNHLGSCDSSTVSRFGTPHQQWGGSWSWEHDIGGGWNKSSDKSDTEESLIDSLKKNQESYEDALPEDYTNNEEEDK